MVLSNPSTRLTLEHARLLLEEEPAQVRTRIDQSIDILKRMIRDLRVHHGHAAKAAF